MAHAKINGINLRYEVQGQGEPIMFFPGLGVGVGYFRFVEPLFSRQFTTVLVDPRGIGGSLPEDKNEELTAEKWADDFAALARHLGFSRVHLVGSSHGGCMAMAMVERHRELIASCSLLGAFSELSAAMEINFRLRVNIVSKLGMGEEIADHITLWTASPRFLDSPAGFEAARNTVNLVRSVDPQRYLALLRSIQQWGRVLPGQESEPKFTARLSAFRTPVLALTGDSDHFIPARMSRMIADAVPRALYREIPQCGHISVNEKPQETFAIVSDFIKQQRIGA